MKVVPSLERIRALLNYDPEVGLMTWKVQRGGMASPGSVAGRADSKGYIQIGVDGRRYLAHRLAWLWMTGDWPVNEIDHIDGNRANNAWCNLRDITSAENKQNRRTPTRGNSSGYLGVSYDKKTKKFRACISVGGRQAKLHHLGFFESAADAHAVYVQAKRLLHSGGTL